MTMTNVTETMFQINGLRYCLNIWRYPVTPLVAETAPWLEMEWLRSCVLIVSAFLVMNQIERWGNYLPICIANNITLTATLTTEAVCPRMLI